MNVIFDTNAIYYLDTTNSNKDKHLTDNEFEVLKENIRNKKIRVYISWLSMIEISSHLKEQPQDFTAIQSGIRRLLELKPVFLPDPETIIREYFLNKKTLDNHKSIIDTREVFTSIKLAPNIDRLENGFEAIEITNNWKNILIANKRKVNFALIVSERTKYEIQFKKDIIDNVLDMLIKKFPHYESKICNAKKVSLTATEKQSLFDDVYNNELIRGFEYRGQTNLTKDEEEAKLTKEKFEFLDKSYQEFILYRILEFGKRNIDKNDYNDMHFNIYFHKYNDYIFITEEKKQVVFNALKNADRFKGLKELCKKIDV